MKNKNGQNQPDKKHENGTRTRGELNLMAADVARWAGSHTSKAKAEAARRNGALGGHRKTTNSETTQNPADTTI